MTVYSVVQQDEPKPSFKNLSHVSHEANDLEHCEPIHKLLSFQTLLRFVVDLLLVVPPLLFLIYGFLVLHNEGRPVDTQVVRELQSAAKYGPTLFPIVFAAIAGIFLKSVAAWNLERGISVLSLEYLLSCRTVFSAVTTPFSLRAFNFLTPFLLIFWALSPLGGQAAFRIIGAVPNTFSLPWNFTYMDYNSKMQYGAPDSSAGSRIISEVLGAFTSALVATQDTKLAPMDAFGNLKIPMLEACRTAGAVPDSDNWYNALPGAGCNYSSLIGLPVVPSTATGAANMSFVIETMYMYTDCTLSHRLTKNLSESLDALKHGVVRPWGGPFHNSIASFSIWVIDYVQASREGPQHLVFTSRTENAITNASCTLTTTYVEAHAFCHKADCRIARVRESANPPNSTDLNVLDRIASAAQKQSFGNPYHGFFTSFVKAGDTIWDPQNTHLYSTPIEYYFTNPGFPYSVQISDNGFRGTDIYTISDTVFSQRFSQLLNTFWLSSIAPTGVTDLFNISSNADQDGTYGVVTTTGDMTPDNFVLECRRAWLAILVIASFAMLFAAIAAAVLGLLRRGPEILDRASLIMRDNPYVNVPAASSMENGFEQARRLKDVRLCLGDVKSALDRGHVAIGTIDVVTPLDRVKNESRLY
ncbi:hypothetical protein DM02DRAFT_599662 [Periconia macrospinosa]|uniref:Uncharacterized protein n=1 Tax=Periconia macrospinosa TaxID=97972 RepID=A0A2V1DDQ1_9PLEO|nr:hypothetical protein DM02DRAFT_599662 [Periconia macrospinosa]